MLGTLFGFVARTAVRSAVRGVAGAAVGAGVSAAARVVRERLFDRDDDVRKGADRVAEAASRGRADAGRSGARGGVDAPFRTGPSMSARERTGRAGGAAPATIVENDESAGRGAGADSPADDPSGAASGSQGGRSESDSDTVSDETTHFGYRTVDREAKAGLVGGVFDSVAPRYDVMNDLMSFGIHRLWKRFTIEQSGVRPGQRTLDLAGGTGDLALKLSRRVGRRGQVLLVDINDAMLRAGRERLIDAGVVGNVDYAQADAEALPFADDTFDCVTIAFGLRNVTDKARALEAMYRVLRPGGRLLVLEFSKPLLPLLSRAYDAYSFTALPLLGKLVADDAESYRYLAESIRMHPDQETLSGMLREAGFERVVHHDLTGGIVALHKGFKL